MFGTELKEQLEVQPEISIIIEIKIQESHKHESKTWLIMREKENH